MSQLYVFPPGFSTSLNPSVGTNGAPIPTSSTEIGAENPGGDLEPLQVDGSGNLLVAAAALPLPTGAATSANQVTELSRLSGSLVPTAFDEVALTYVPSGPGAGQVATAVYKLASATVKTLTLSYDGSDRLIDVIAS